MSGLPFTDAGPAWTGRIAFDSYYTPRTIAAAIVGWLRIPPDWTVWEPHAGSGAFVDALTASGHSGGIIASDLNPASRCCSVGIPGARCVQGDALRMVADRAVRPGIVLGNPPYDDAASHVAALLGLGVPVSLLLRATFLGSDERSDLLARHPPAVVWRFMDRISFDGTRGADNVQHEQVTWLPGHAGPAAFSLVRARAGWTEPPAPRWR